MSISTGVLQFLDSLSINQGIARPESLAGALHDFLFRRADVEAHRVFSLFANARHHEFVSALSSFGLLSFSSVSTRNVRKFIRLKMRAIS